MDLRPKKAKNDASLPYTEIFKLEKLLKNSNIKFSFYDESKTYAKGYQIIVNEQISIIQNRFSFGSKEDKLEMWKLGTSEEPIGYLTAEECFEKIKNEEL